MNDETNSGRSVWRQPLVHFLLAGAAIFALDALRGTPEPADSQRIVVTVAQVERMAGLWQKTWGRPPSESELQALVRDHIKEEIYYREALKLGLDVNDTVIRRRLRQKMEFLTTDDVNTSAPLDGDLQAFYEANAERYRRSPVFDFEQVYIAAASDNRAQQLLGELRNGANSEALGEAISLPRAMSRADEATIARTFGSAFYAALDAIEPGTWSGPVPSGFGRHLVRISNKEAARIPALQDVRGAVENDWRAERSTASREQAYAILRASYEVDIEVPAE